MNYHVEEEEEENMVGTLLGEKVCSCSCLTVLPGSGWVLLNKIYPFYTSVFTTTLKLYHTIMVLLPYEPFIIDVLGSSTMSIRLFRSRSRFYL